MYSNANNLKSEIVGSVSANDSTVSITPGEGVLRANDTVACLEHYENEICTKREVIKITSITDNTLTITRSFAVCVMNDKTKEKGDTAFSFDEGDFLSMYLSKELRESLTDGVGENQTAYETMLENLAVPRTCINNCLTTRQSAIDTAYRTKFGGLAGFGNGSDGDCVISEDTFLDAGREYNFRNLTICPDVLVRFEGAGVPTINVRDTFRNCGIIELKAPYVPNCSILENRCVTGKSVNNICTDWGPCCGGKGGARQSCCGGSSGCDGCPGSETSGGYGGNAYGCAGCAPDGLNGGRGANGCYQLRGSGGGGGGGGGGRYGNGGRGGNGGKSYCPSGAGKGGDGGNSGLYGTGGTGGTGGSICEESGGGPGGNGGNGYYGGEGGTGKADYALKSSGDGGCGVIEGGKGGDAYCNKQSCGGKGGNAITNVYGFHLNARNIYNYCVNARGGKGGLGGDGDGSDCTTWYACGGKGGNGANGGQMIINYKCMFEEGCFDVRGGEGGLGGRTYACESGYPTKKHRAQSGEKGNDGRKIMYALNEENITNTAIYTFGDTTKLYREDPHFTPSDGRTRGKTLVVYSVEDFPISPEEGTEVVESTVYNQYKDEPYTLTLAEGTYYFSFFSYDTEDNLLSVFQKKLHIIGGIQYVIVGGGGGGGASGKCNAAAGAGCGGGGGGAGLVKTAITCLGGDFNIHIGCGGLGGTDCQSGENGGDTLFGREVAYGGGGGGGFCLVGCDGGSGGGGGARLCNGGNGCGGAGIGFGNNGGKACYGGGGGGGSCSNGGAGNAYCGGAGGSGKCILYNPCCGTSCCFYVAGGGGGGGCCSCAGGAGCGGLGGAGGSGGAGCSTKCYGSGGGGGGGGYNSTARVSKDGGNGGNGLVLISYCNACGYHIEGGNCIFCCCGYKVHRFISNGNLSIG